MKELIGLASGLIVAISIIPYAIRTYQRKIEPQFASWIVWSVLGFAILVTYHSSGATSNVWPAVFGFSNPLLVTLIVFGRGKRDRPTKLDTVCLVAGLISIIVWWFVRDVKRTAQYALYVAIVADMCAGIPTVVFVWKTPNADRPFAWLMFSVGYGLTFFAITEHTFANYVLPAYMTTASSLVAIPLITYRVRNKTKWTEWI